MKHQAATVVCSALLGICLPIVAVVVPASAATTSTGFNRIQAQNYSSATGPVLKQPSGDIEDPTNMGLALLTRANVLTYNGINFGSAPATALDLRLASAANEAGGTIAIHRGGATGAVIASVVVPKTGSWQNYKNIQVPLTTSLTGTQDITVQFHASNGNPFVNLNWLQFISDATAPTPSPPATPTLTPTPTPTPTATPTPTPTPAPTGPTTTGFNRIEAEGYSSVNAPVLKQPSGDSQDPNNPGLALLTRGTVLSYNNVDFGSAAASSVDLRIASAVNEAGGTITVHRGSANGEVVASLPVPKTGTWQAFQTVHVPLRASLTGAQNVYVTFSATNGNPFVNLNWLQFATDAQPVPTQPPASNPTPAPTPTPTPTPTQPPASNPGLIVKFVNNTGQPDSNIYLTADAGGVGNATYTGTVGNRFKPGLGNSVALTDLIGPGTDAAAHTYTFVIDGYAGGRLYYSIGSGFSGHWPSAHDETRPFDMVELNANAQNKGDFFGDLSAMEQIGIPSNLQMLDVDGAVIQTQDGPADRSIACYSDVYNDLVKSGPAGWDASGVRKTQTNGNLLRLVGPNADVSRYPSLKGYVKSLHGQTLRIKGRFGGTGTLAGAYYDYSSVVDNEGNLLLKGTSTDPNDPSKPNANYPKPSTIFVAANDLYSNATPGQTGYGIYLQNGPFTLDGTVTGDGVTSPFRLTPGTGTTQAIQNDLYGWMYGDLVTAYAYGYWGGKYGNDSSQFVGKAPFAATRTKPESFATWNIWEQAIWDTSDSYGMALGERFGAGGKKSPLIGIGSGAQTMQITLKSDCS